MKTILSMAAAAMLVVSGAGAMAAELPGYQVSGFPISQVQVQLLGAANAQEQPPVAGPAANGITPVQLTVLMPRAKRTAAALQPAVIGVVAR